MVTLQGQPIKISGQSLKDGDMAKDFTLVDTDLRERSLSDFKGKRLILNIFPSIDTGVCASSVRKFNKEAVSLENTQVLCISEDLPFAHQRFCGAEGIEDVISLSAFRDEDFAERYGLRIEDSPLAGLLSRAVIVTDETGKVIHSELVPEIAQEPDYELALESLGSSASR